MGAAWLRRERGQRHDVLHRHTEGVHHERDVLLEADLPADRGRGPSLPDRLAGGVEARSRKRHARARARDRWIRADQFRGCHVLRPHAAVPRQLVLRRGGTARHFKDDCIC